MLIALQQGDIHGAVIQLCGGIAGMIVDFGQLSSVIPHRLLQSILSAVTQPVLDILLLLQESSTQPGELL